MSIYDWKGALAISDEALGILKSKKTASLFSLLLFSAQKLSCTTQLRLFEAGEETARYCLSLLQEGSANWYRVYSLMFYQYTYTNNFYSALEIYRTAVTNPEFTTQEGFSADNWYRFGGYLH